MLLFIDVGNTHTQFGVYEKGKLHHDYRVASEVVRTEDEIGIVILSLLEHDGIKARKIQGVGISSVVPNLTGILERMSRKYFGCDPLVVNSDLDLGIEVAYDEPRSVGSDRICAAVAGYRKYGGPLIILDFGTATTFDVVSAEGVYLGGGDRSRPRNRRGGSPEAGGKASPNRTPISRRGHREDYRQEHAKRHHVRSCRCRGRDRQENKSLAGYRS